MPRRVNLIVLLCLTIVIVLSVGLSAGARPKSGAQSAEPGGELEKLQREAEAANGAYKNSLDEENRLNNEIAKTRNDLTENEKQLADTQSSVGDRAEEIYKHGNLTMMDALTRTDNIRDFSNMFGLLTQQLGQDQDQVKKLRETRDSLQQTEKDLESQIESRKATLEEEAAKKDETQNTMKEAQAAFDSLKPEDREKIKKDRVGRVRDAVKNLYGGPVAQGASPKAGDEASDTQGASPKAEPKDEASDAQGETTPRVESGEVESGDKASDGQASDAQGETTPKIELAGDDQERQAQFAQAIDETIHDWVAQGKLPAREGSGDSTGSDGAQPENPMAKLVADVTEKQAEANRQAKEAADQVTAEQEAQKKAAEQADAAQRAERDAQQASAKKQPDAQTTAEEAQRQADLAAKDAAAQKSAAQGAADQAVTQRGAADDAATQLAAQKASEVKKPQAGLPVEVSGNKDGAVDPGTKLVVPGDFGIDPGSTVTYEDADGTRGTATDGINAKIVKGSIDTTVTAPLDNVSGGDGKLSTDGLKIVDTTGITAGPGESVAVPPPAPNSGGTTGPQPAPITKAVGAPPNPGASGQPGLQPAPGLQPPPSRSQGGVVGEADTWLGVPYVHGGDSRSGIDCSAFTAAVYAKFGVILPDSPVGQWGMGTPVSGPPQAGDLVFWSEDGSGAPTHVGIADGKGNTIHASDYFMDVAVTPIDNIPGYLGARRFF